MNILERTTKEFDAIYTGTVEHNCFNQEKSNLDKISINYDNCISFYDLILAINKMHKAFKKEYDKLDKLSLGREIEYEYFHKSVDELGNTYRLLSILIQKPKIIDDNYTFLNLQEVNGVSVPYVTNNKGSFMNDKGFYRKKIKLSANKTKNYLDLFEKYNILFKLYRHIKKQFIFSDTTYSLYTDIYSHNSKFTDELNTFKLCFYSDNYENGNDRIILLVNLGDDLTFDLNNSCIILNDKDISLTNEICANFLKNVHINSKFLETKNKTKREYEQPMIKMLINNNQ